MPDSDTIGNNFLEQITAIIEQNIANEHFGVSELADAVNMSRSNLLRKVKKEARLSVSQFINQVRLKRAMELLRKSSMNVSEVSLQVGFNSPSYFIKCFREYYGYPPGEVGKRQEDDSVPVVNETRDIRKYLIGGSVALVILLTISLLVYNTHDTLPPNPSPQLEKSIAVLPFKNDSDDSTNVYLINGLMESTLNDLQKIKDLRVISRTSTEKYRATTKSIPEMAKELNVNYFVEGSGQKIGNRILLNIQLIEASTDKHLWGKQYRREAKDIFELQLEVASNIAAEISAIITPEERERIGKKPTNDLEAYDLFLKGRNLLMKGGNKNLETAVSLYKKAIARDPKFALAYAEAGIAYYYLDLFQQEKKYSLEIESYANNAVRLDSTLAQGLAAKGMSYMTKKEFASAVPYFEKALVYNPNSVLVIHLLSDFYANYSPNTSRYLEYALMGIKLDIASQDSVTIGYNYLHLSNALAQLGFLDEANIYVDKSLDYTPDNPYGYVKIYFEFAKDRDLRRAAKRMTAELKKDKTRLDVLQEVAKLYYMARSYDTAYRYYRRLDELRDSLNLEIYAHENLKFALVYSKMGFNKKANEFAEAFWQYAENDKSIYKHASLAGYYAYKNKPQKALEHLRLFSKEDNIQYWMLLLKDDPIVDSIKDLPEFRQIMSDIESRFWKTHERTKALLKEKGLL